MLFEEIVCGWTNPRTTDKMWSQKLTLSPCDRWAKKKKKKRKSVILSVPQHPHYLPPLTLTALNAKNAIEYF